MLRCIQIAHKLIHRGEQPTPEGIKRAYDIEIGRDCTREFYDRHNHNNDHYDFSSPPLKQNPPQETPFITYSPGRGDNRTRSFTQTVLALHRFESVLDDVDFEILYESFDELTPNERTIIDSKLKEIHGTDPIRYKRLNNMFMNKYMMN